MSVVIGSRYLENLMRLSGLIRNLFNGGYQEDPEVLLLDRKDGRCYYYSCNNKKEGSNKLLVIKHDDGRKEVYAFHADCLDNLLID